MNATNFILSDVPATPPTPPAGYGPAITYRVIRDGRGGGDALDTASWAARRAGTPDPAQDFDYAVRTWVEQGVESFDLYAEAECGGYSATCRYDRHALYSDWSAWVNTGDMRSPCVTPEQMAEYAAEEAQS